MKSMNKEKIRAWLRAAGIRALKTVAQAAVATIGTEALLQRVDWLAVLSTAALAGILSLLTSLAGLPEVSSASPAGVPENAAIPAGEESHNDEDEGKEGGDDEDS